VAGGLVAWDGPEPVFAGDAIADPLSGLIGAVATLAALHAPGSWLVDVSMRDVAAWTVRAGGTSGPVVVLPPRLASRRRDR